MNYDHYEYGLPTHNDECLEDMRVKLEEYADQARREERERHMDAILLLRAVRAALIIKEQYHSVKDIETALAAAGYEGKEKE